MGTGSATHVPGRLNRTRAPLFALLSLAGVLCATQLYADEPPQEPLARFPSAELTIESRGTIHRFHVYIAATEPRRNQGLMFVKKLAPDRGMLFLWEAPQTASFWMKNTVIPLDLLFIAPDWRVIRIAENATPLSLATIDSMGVVTGVLEVAGGTSHRLGIQPGDRVRYPAVDTR
jgi:uncharacterized membrane protein (UPF0127 family)